MKFDETDLPGAFILEHQQHRDNRGFFARLWCAQTLEERGLESRLSQASQSFNARAGTLRGLHYQASHHQETKIVHCTRGALFDVIVDLRSDSPTYRSWTAVELSAGNNRSVYIPAGFAHGFITLEDDTEVVYFISEPHTPGAERGLRWNDPTFKIDWPRPVEVISRKDTSWPDFDG